MCLVLYNCRDSSVLMLYPCWVLIKCTTFGESDRHPFTFFKSLSNISCMTNMEE